MIYNLKHFFIITQLLEARSYVMAFPKGQELTSFMTEILEIKMKESEDATSPLANWTSLIRCRAHWSLPAVQPHRVDA